MSVERPVQHGRTFEIVPGLYQGCHLSRTLPPELKAVINLDDASAEYATDHLDEYHHFPIPDGPDPGEKWIENVVATATRIRAAGLPLYIHCRAGISRSVFVTAALLMAEFGVDPKEAIHIINSKTDQADPAPAFVRRLYSLHDKCR